MTTTLTAALNITVVLHSGGDIQYKSSALIIEMIMAHTAWSIIDTQALLLLNA